MDKLSKTYVIFFSNCVYPRDDKKHKDAVIAGRLQIIQTVLENLDCYRKVYRSKRSRGFESRL